jgi:CheY-like chemotaxis protein
MTLLGRQWFSIVVTDRAMPVMDGIDFVFHLRAIAVAPVYVIMLTVSDDSHDYERGYCAGVDHYLSKKGFEADLIAKVTAGLTAMRRRHSAAIGSSNAPVTVDLESGAHTARHLVGRLHAEIAHAARLKKTLHVLSVCIDPRESTPGRLETVNPAASELLLQAVHSSVRAKLDWVARLPAGRSVRLAVVMPESTDADVAAVEQSIRNAFVRSNQDPNSLKLSMGAAPLVVQGEKPPTALELIGEAERIRRGQQQARAKEVASIAGALRNVQGGEEPKASAAA